MLNNIKRKEKRNIRILFISSDPYPCYRSDVFVLFEEKLVSKGHTICWMLKSKRNSKSSYKVKWLNSNVYVGPNDEGTKIVNKLRKNYYFMLHVSKIFKILKNETFDIVLMKDMYFSALIILAASKLFRKKLLYWISYPYPDHLIYLSSQKSSVANKVAEMRGYFLKWISNSITMKFVNHIFVQSEQMKRDYISNKIKEEKITAVPMGFSKDKIPFYGYRKKYNNETKKIIYLGTLVKIRKLDFVLKVMKKVLNEIGNVKLYLIGGGENNTDEEFLIQESLRLGINESVHITGCIEQKKAWELIEDADICISPFYPIPILNSTSPTKLIEYMAMGKVVVGNHHPEQTKIIEESNGGICVDYEIGRFAEAIIYLLNNRDQCRIMGTLGRKYVEKFREYEIIANEVEAKILAVYREKI